MSRISWILLLLFAVGLWRCASDREVMHGPGVLVAEAPQQRDLADAASFAHGEFRLQPLADFSLRARVLSREDYRFDAQAQLSPIDLALGWGRMSDSAVIEQLDIRQAGRFYRYRWGAQGPPIPAPEIVRSSANMHLVPADAAVAAVLDRVRRGDVVHFRGQLIEAVRADGWRWRSSLSREDSGAGACELVWVTALSIEPR
jgi:hypothetical protein